MEKHIEIAANDLREIAAHLCLLASGEKPGMSNAEALRLVEDVYCAITGEPALVL